MTLRAKRSDTLVKSIEKAYGVDLHARADAKLGTILSRRGYSSQSQLFKAMSGKLDFHPKTRNVFISFHSEDFHVAQGLRLMFLNQKLDLDMEDVSRKSVRSENETYVRSALKARLRNANVLMCVLGNGTGSREWVEWELETALALGIPVCGVRIPNTYGKMPILLKQHGGLIADWEAVSITRIIETAIARGV